MVGSCKHFLGDTAQAGFWEWWRWNLEPGLGMGLRFVPRIMDSVPCGEPDIWGACIVGRWMRGFGGMALQIPAWPLTNCDFGLVN